METTEAVRLLRDLHGALARNGYPAVLDTRAGAAGEVQLGLARVDGERPPGGLDAPARAELIFDFAHDSGLRAYVWDAAGGLGDGERYADGGDDLPEVPECFDALDWLCGWYGFRVRGLRHDHAPVGAEDERDECDACGRPGATAHGRNDDPEAPWLCERCYSTPVGGEYDEGEGDDEG